MDHQQVIQTITTALQDDPDVSALFLSGSHGNGLADDYSDIDFVLVTKDGVSDAIAAKWRSAIEQTGEIILLWDRTTRPSLINAITADWTRTDVIIAKPDQLGSQTQDMLKPLIDHAGLYQTLGKEAPPPKANPRRIKYEIEDFIRILGLMHLAVGRKEHINGVMGVFHLRNYLVNLMIEETAAPHRGGVLHLNRLTTDEQRAVLASLPPPVPERDAMIEAHLAYAAAYLPRARRFAKKLDIEWPERFEDITWQMLEQTLGVFRPYGQSQEPTS